MTSSSLSIIAPFLTAAALLVLGSAGAAHAQADGAAIALPGPFVQNVPALPSGRQRMAPDAGPGAALMNELHERMQQIQATPDPMLRHERMDEFLKTLQQGMADIGGQPAQGAGR